MTAAAKLNFGNYVKIAPSPTTPSTNVAELLTITPPGQSRDTIDVTTHDSAGGAMEFIGEGIYDPGEMKIGVHYIAGSTADTAFDTAMTSAAKQNVVIGEKKATGFKERSFAAIVNGYAVEDFEIKGKQVATVTLKVTGPITKADAA